MKLVPLAMQILLLFLSCSKSNNEKFISEYSQARIAYLNTDFQKSVEILKKIPESSDISLSANFLLAKTYFMQNKADQAVKLFKKIIKKHPKHGDAKLWLARSLLATENPNQAKIVLDDALLWNGGDPRLLALMAKCLQILGMTDQALEYLQQAMFFEEELIGIYLTAATIYSHNRIEDQKIYYLEKAEKLATQDSLFYQSIQNALHPENQNNEQIN